ncbi:MAG: HNH endonuclease [Ignavibacteria bacterium]|nr:HNH endonuclease [Ignavibacteria bacterium]NCS87789.1 HNH endonuclease [Ignavibacteria bacterium]OIO16030.1 MAG: hypothetical protein AUJ54_11815 [Ignavibacteria bacterium CG1_02_37_35]
MKRIKRFTLPEKKDIFNKTLGHCHFCGDALIFERRGRNPYPPLSGQWEIDHVVQVSRGGKESIENNLPICTQCNMLRWFRSGNNLREILRLGLVAKDEVIKDSATGKKLVELNSAREIKKQSRRSKPKTNPI